MTATSPAPRRAVGPGPELRSLLLALQVLADLDLELTDRWLQLPGGHRVAWRHVRAAGRGLRAEDEGDRRRFGDWLETLRRLHALPVGMLPDLVRPVGLTTDHVLHPGAGWAQVSVLGGTLELGMGVLGLDPSRPEVVVVVEPSVWAALRVDPAPWWNRCRRLLEEMGGLAARRWAVSTDRQLRPMGDCDVLTLLGSVALREELAGSDGGMRAVVVPMRRRGWTRLSRLDPAFAPAAAMATDPVDRGVLRPLLITADEVVLAGDGGRVDISLADPLVERWDAASVAS